MTTSRSDGNTIVRFFEWWNEAMKDEALLTEEAFRQYFTRDGSLIVNGELRAQGCEALSRHYKRIKASVDKVGMTLPVVAEGADGDLDFVHVFSDVVVDGKPRTIEAMAYAEVEGDRMRVMRVLSI